MARPSPKKFINLQQPSYRRLRSIFTERTSPIVLWCGAGLSMPVGLPDWQGLKNKLLTDLEEKALSFLDSDPARDKLLQKGIFIDEEGNIWVAFSMLEKALGNASFQAGIREHLNLPHALEVPLQYLGFWNVGIRGVVNLNLDRLATRAYAESKHESLLEIASSNINAAPNVIGSGKDFVLNLHGVLEDTNSWILTYEDLKKLQNKSAYRTTLSALFSNFTVVFAGISADDVAIGGFLETLTKSGIDLGSHFWITARMDEATDRWAENAGLQIIRYSPEGDHQLAFHAMFEDLNAFTPEEDVPPVVHTSLVESQDTITKPEELASRFPEEIRNEIASYARDILEQSKEPFPKEYRTFALEYARPIYNSWYVNMQPPDNSFFGHQIYELLGEGAFAKVYKATTPDGNECAIKIMHQNLAHDETMLACFRRGINSMRILEGHKVKGMIRLNDAVELPAAIFMEYVNGPTLEMAVESRSIEPWDDGIKLLLRVAKIIREGHQLPERVLHRDLRPSNIMLRNFYDPDEETEVVVLDFDLSWHRGAYDVTLTQHAQAALGYLAPEQVHRDMKVSTRNAAVDTYGLCATIYFVFAGEHPHQGLFRSEDFQQHFRRKIASVKQGLVQSAGNRLRRVVTSGVSWNQANRPDFGEIERDLLLLHNAVNDVSAVDSPDFWAEEMLCWARGEDGYRYDADRNQYVAELASGLNIICAPEFATSSVELVISYAGSGDVDRRKNVGKFLRKRLGEAISALEKFGFVFQKGSKSTWGLSYSMSATIKVHLIQEKLNNISETIKIVFDRLAIE